MAEQNIEVIEDPSAPKPPANANGIEAEHQGDDVEALKAEIAALKKSHGTALNELKATKKAREAERAMSEKMKHWVDLENEYHIEPAQLREQLKAREEADLGEAKSKGDVEKLLANRDQKHQRDLAKKEEETSAIRAQYQAERELNDRLLVDMELRTELAKVVEPSLLRGAFALHRPKAKAIDDDEAEYGRRPVIDVDGDHMATKDYIKQWAETDPEAQGYLIGNRSSGGGSPAGGKSAGGVPRMRRSQMTAKQKSDFMSAYTVEAYNKLPW